MKSNCGSLADLKRLHSLTTAHQQAQGSHVLDPMAKKLARWIARKQHRGHVAVVISDCPIGRRDPEHNLVA